MADTVTSVVLPGQTKKRLVVRATVVSDGTGSTDAILVDKSTLTGLNGLEPNKLVIEKLEFTCDGMIGLLEFDHTVDDPICTLAGTFGIYDFAQNSKYQGFVDPGAAGATGDIVITTTGHTAGDSINVVLYLRKKD